MPPEDMNRQTVTPWYCCIAHYQLHTNPWQLCARPLCVGKVFHMAALWSRDGEKRSILLFYFFLTKNILHQGFGPRPRVSAPVHDFMMA